MESGFKKLWSRKKSWGAADQPSRPRKLSSSNGVSGQTLSNATKDGRPSMTNSRQPVERASQDRMTNTRDLTLATNGDEFGRTKSGHRIQPMLVGISRPETAKDRPDTAGSLQNAVQRAADSVGYRPSDVSNTQPVPIKIPQISKPVSRHIDIFSVSGSVPTYLSRYNEDIAERNLDTLRLAMENTPYVYDPSSKYQEEVAIRNAYLPYKNRPSMDSLRPSMDQQRTTSFTNRSVRSVISPLPKSLHSQQPSTDSTGYVMRALQDQPTQHFRQLSQRSRDGIQLPSIPQEAIEDYLSAKRDDSSLLPEVPYSPKRPLPPIQTPRDAKMQTISEGRPYEARHSTANTSNTARDSGHASNNTFPDYKLSVLEYGGPLNTTQPYVSEQVFNLRSGAEAIFGPPSTRSTTSSIRRAIILPNRTIMDLTDDGEYFDETSSTIGPYNYSPVLEQAKSDAFRKVTPSQIHTEERWSSKAGIQLSDLVKSLHSQRSPTFNTAPQIVGDIARIETPYRTPSKVTQPVQFINDAALRNTQENVQNEDITEQRVQTETTPIVIAATQPERIPSPTSTFSPISTVASWSPRSSAYIPKPVEPLSMTARVAAALEASRAIARENPLPPSNRTGTETPTVREGVASFESNVDRSNTPPSSAVELNSTTLPAKVDILLQTVPVPVTQPVTQPVAQPVEHPVERNAATKPTAVKPSGKIPHTQSVYALPESITSVDYTSPGNTFGIRTRDFALSPRKSVSSLKKASTPKATPQNPRPITITPSKARPKSKSTKSRSKQSTPAVSKMMDTGFDEEAFARKQAEARAALERLQRSLSENFITMPDRDTVQLSKGKEKDLENKSVAPANVATQEVKTTTGTTSTQRPDSGPPPSAFRNSRGEPNRSSLNSNARSLSSGSRSSRRAPAPSQLKNIESASSPIDLNMLSPALLQSLHNSKPPKSPGEISLSSFPVPSSSRPPSQPDAPIGYHSQTNSFAGIMKRRNSTKSQGSTASGFSIPLHMVPGRTSSVRDPVPEEVDTWG